MSYAKLAGLHPIYGLCKSIYLILSFTVTVSLLIVSSTAVILYIVKFRCQLLLTHQVLVMQLDIISFLVDVFSKLLMVL